MTYLLSVTAALGVLVSVNGLSVFLVSTQVNRARVPAITGNLTLADQLFALPAVLIWGWLADRVSTKLLVVSGHCFAALALALFPLARSPYPDLLLLRLLFAAGGSALTTSMASALASFAPRPDAKTSEEEPLLTPASAQRDRSPLIAGAAGLASGLGALIAGAYGLQSTLTHAVFLYLRLPTVLGKSVGEGLARTFWVIAGIEVAVAIVTFILLPSRPSDRPQRPLFSQLTRLISGFGLLVQPLVALASVSSFSARASTIAVAQLIPLWIADYYQRTGRCDLRPGEDLKEGCHSAFALASSITGTIQLVALLAAPGIGFLGSRRPHRIPNYLLHASVIGVIGWLFMAALVDPRKIGVAIPSGILIGASEITNVVLSLALCGIARTKALEKSTAAEEDDVSGAIAGIYTLFGALGVLVTARLGSAMLNSAWSPFVVVAAANSVSGIAALAVILRNRYTS